MQDIKDQKNELEKANQKLEKDFKQLQADYDK
jgi:hypothetical protein